MTEIYQTGFQLLLVGMITVFAVLSIVVLSGRLLIAGINRIYSDEKTDIRPAGEFHSLKSEVSRRTSDKHKIAAVVAATFITTKGKGKIRKIEKEDS